MGAEGLQEAVHGGRSQAGQQVCLYPLLFICVCDGGGHIGAEETHG